MTARRCSTGLILILVAGLLAPGAAMADRYVNQSGFLEMGQSDGPFALDLLPSEEMEIFLTIMPENPRIGCNPVTTTYDINGQEVFDKMEACYGDSCSYHYTGLRGHVEPSCNHETITMASRTWDFGYDLQVHIWDRPGYNNAGNTFDEAVAVSCNQQVVGNLCHGEFHYYRVYLYGDDRLDLSGHMITSPTIGAVMEVRIYDQAEELIATPVTAGIYGEGDYEGSFVNETGAAGWFYVVPYGRMWDTWDYTMRLECGLIPIELVSLSALRVGDRATIRWNTASEIDTAGFNILRSEEEDGTYERVNAALIPAEGGPSWGASYVYEDAPLPAEDTFWYKLEDVDIYGASTLHGPVAAAPLGIWNVDRARASTLSAVDRIPLQSLLVLLIPLLLAGGWRYGVRRAKR